MLAEEKPCLVVVTRPIRIRKNKRLAKSAKRKLARSFRGFIRERIREKCEERAIEFVKISSKDTRLVCSNCGELGQATKDNRFHCDFCGYEASIFMNEAVNIENKYRRSIV